MTARIAPIQGVAAASHQSGWSISSWTLRRAAAGSATLITQPPLSQDCEAPLTPSNLLPRRQVP